MSYENPLPDLGTIYSAVNCYSSLLSRLPFKIDTTGNESIYQDISYYHVQIEKLCDHKRPKFDLNYQGKWKKYIKVSYKLYD